MTPLKVLLIQPVPIRAASHLALGLGYLASVLKPKGATTTILDAGAPYRKYTNDEIISIIKKEKYDMVGITLTTFFASWTSPSIVDIPKSLT